MGWGIQEMLNHTFGEDTIGASNHTQLELNWAVGIFQRFCEISVE